ncbi:hypothetical protein L873DRAFT_100119 [Choiromyces venosus 120613-1]|uniref:DUF676 domain-containing protein n=1 Tax=Choiromyces venosus 120613-1 TaxID=1336337 RepID=A0A3N4JZI4_9PEZI|nr:hypothetical protein L873DRAFT_100119 [Choiromyces venosus 120613-1]
MHLPHQSRPDSPTQNHGCWSLFASCFTSCLGGPGVKQRRPNEGLTHFHMPENHDITIVAIHGLAGHMERTWTHKTTNNIWLKDNLPFADDFKNARIYSFGYDANLIGSQSVATIGQIANNLNQSLIDMQDTKPLIFVCHSLGGIIAKSAIIQTKLKHTEASQNLYRRIRGIVFFGTPHQGSEEADLGTLAANTLRVVPFFRVNKKLIKSIQRDKDGLSEISENFVNCLNDGYLFVVCFYETKMILLSKTPPF